jgi:hypothetical protein
MILKRLWSRRVRVAERKSVAGVTPKATTFTYSVIKAIVTTVSDEEVVRAGMIHLRGAGIRASFEFL